MKICFAYLWTGAACALLAHAMRFVAAHQYIGATLFGLLAMLAAVMATYAVDRASQED